MYSSTAPFTTKYSPIMILFKISEPKTDVNGVMIVVEHYKNETSKNKNPSQRCSQNWVVIWHFKRSLQAEEN